jgi:SAM-dependent methyltransferase
VAVVTAASGNMDRFSGFADLYDANRPSAPTELGPLLVSYAGVSRPDVIDLGSGTGLSSRWAAAWASSVVGVEPNPDMRAQALARPTDHVTYRDGTSSNTGLPDASADIVLAVQAMHWMEPASTLTEVARVLRPGGVFAALDADWPPVSGVTGAEVAWHHLHRRIRVFEARAARGDTADALRAPVDDGDPALVDDDMADPHRNRAMPGGVVSWSKSQHLERIGRSGRFAFVREVMMHQTVGGGADAFIALMHSQGSYQGLRRLGLDDDELGATAFEAEVRDAYSRVAAGSAPPLAFSWRVRLGVLPGSPT